MRLFSISTLILLALGGSAVAADGVYEINQACALSTGCFLNDAAGFPVTITASGSYLLTSNLVVADVDTNGIEVSEKGVTIDLNGFAVSGPRFCPAGSWYAAVKPCQPVCDLCRKQK